MIVQIFPKPSLLADLVLGCTAKAISHRIAIYKNPTTTDSISLPTTPSKAPRASKSSAASTPAKGNKKRSTKEMVSSSSSEGPETEDYSALGSPDPGPSPPKKVKKQANGKVAEVEEPEIKVDFTTVKDEFDSDNTD